MHDQDGPDLDLEPLFARGDTGAVRAALAAMHPADAASAMAALPLAQARAALGLLPGPARRAAVFDYLPDLVQTELARSLPRPELAALVAAMSHDDRADLFRHLAPEEREALLPALAQAEREDLRRLASYPEGTAGAVMTSDYATLAPDLTAREAIEALRREAPDRETIYVAYVVDPERRLLGAVSLRDLVLAPAGTRVATLMRRDPAYARVDEPRGGVAARIARYDLLALPVLDAEGRLVGIVTQDDAMDVAEAEATEDFRKAGAVPNLAAGLRDAGVGLLYRRRVGWLVALVFGNLLSGAGIAAFEDVIAANLALVFFLPLLIASAGNAGAQAATLTVRALATGDVRMSDWGRLLAREALVALALGGTMAAAVAAVGLLRGGPGVALVAALTMVLVVLVGSLVGLSLPFLLDRLGLDPASASAPLVTSVADVTGVLIYLGIANALLPVP
ncbi:magnesium transporter [Siccirubricoccus sp. G192]|uniref:magnesium transporter n=1 Tax=Siccirubricoccus sp. G192 TaxID=2849651 RepID=UPI001C2B7EC4|nr:magnesium transporter [Siccirubricoccus sp. G192]MBV1796183.1 magnesium transporter [Siccirubricoccus sp. G192]